MKTEGHHIATSCREDENDAMQEHAVIRLQGWREPLNGDWRHLIQKLLLITAGTIQLKQGQPFPPKAFAC